ncbi:hypothetical protein J2S43_006204 [Catenuloplanes nepalensis]|uniref:Uncharacterized protein n=1 Tax=Catenuloplanes nepalensis TaxID=587533 RepID=A0ABT9N1X3_9ACTN|nr:hypothetical protein [Catenuloplanes nepalensis]MDP9797692.1 hypothetical protein [Catenuloplanes nepalensis]
MRRTAPPRGERCRPSASGQRSRYNAFNDAPLRRWRARGDAFDAKSGFGIRANELPEANQGPAVGAVTFDNLRLSTSAQDIRNTTPLRITINP